MTDLRVEIHPAGQPWFTGPTEELPPPDWARRARRLLRRRVASIRSFVDSFDADPVVDELVHDVAARSSDAPPRRWCLVRWLDARESPVVLEAEPVRRTSASDLSALLRDRGDGERLLGEEALATHGPTIQRVLVGGPSGEPDEGEFPSRIEARFIVDAGDPEGVTLARARMRRDDLDRIGPELDTIVATARVRPADVLPTRSVRRARRLRRLESFPVAGVPVAVVAFLALALPFAVALSAPGGTDGVEAWQQALRDRPIDRTRTVWAWALALVALSLLLTLRRDAPLVGELGDRDYGNYLVLGALVTVVGCGLAAPAPIVVGLTVLVAATVVRWRARRHRGPRDRFQAALLVLALVGLMRWAVGGALRAAAAWELSPRAPEAQVEAWIDQRLPGWADLATLDLVGLVLLNVAALLPLVAYLRSGIDFYFGFPFALGVVLLLGVVVLSGGWAGVATLVVVGPPLWRTGRAHDRARFAALGEGRRPPGVFDTRR